MKEMIDKRFTKEELEDSLEFHMGVVNNCIRNIKANKEKLESFKDEEQDLDLLYYIESDSSTLAFHNVLAIGCQYVLGYSAEELHESYKLMRDHIYNDFKGLVWIQLIALSVLFEDGIDTIKHLINVIDKYKRAETTIDYLIHACNLKRNYYCKYTHLVEAKDDFATYIVKLAMEDKEKASSEFVSYIKKIEPENTYRNESSRVNRAMACCQMYDYAALAKVLDLDDSPLKNNIRYPYRLAHYKREMKFYPEKMLDIPKLEYKKGIPEHPSLEKIIPYHFHESVNELIHDYRNMDDVNEFFKKHWWIYNVFDKDEFPKMKKEDEKRTIGLLLIYLLSDDGFIFVFEDEEDLEQAYLYKGMWPDRRTRGIVFDIPGSQYYIAYIPASSKLKTFFGIKMIDIKEKRGLEDYQEELKPFMS